MAALGIDHGTRRCGIAIEIAGIALPRAVVPTALVLHEVSALIEKYSVTTIVVGISPHMSGHSSRQSGIQESFTTLIAREFPQCQIVLQNEAFSSKQARYELEAAGLDSTGDIDDQAAAIILQDYLNSQDSK